MNDDFYIEQIESVNGLFNTFYKDFFDLISLKSEELKEIPIENS
jgi:hypothetical protein